MRTSSRGDTTKRDGDATLRPAVWVATTLVGVACIAACAAVWLVARAEASTSEGLNLAALGFLVAGNGVFTTVLASSFTPEIQVERGSLN